MVAKTNYAHLKYLIIYKTMKPPITNFHVSEGNHTQ